MRSPASSALLINFISIVDAIQSINMFSTSAILMFAAISSILPHTSAAPFESPNLAKRDGAMFTLTGNLPGWSNAPIQARDSMFFIGGGGPKTSCPPGEQCPATEKTVFQCVADNTNTTCYLATKSGKQPIYLDVDGALIYAPSYMYGGLAPANKPNFKHIDDRFMSSQVYGNGAGAFFHENWIGCASNNSNNPQDAAPYAIFFAITGGNGCPRNSVWIQVRATPVSAAEAYAYAT